MRGEKMKAPKMHEPKAPKGFKEPKAPKGFKEPKAPKAPEAPKAPMGGKKNPFATGSSAKKLGGYGL